MIQKFDYNYDFYNAKAIFEVDTEKLKKKDAILYLDFFAWKYDKEANPIDELLKKMAIMVIRIATSENYSSEGVINWSIDAEGVIPLDGSSGIKLIDVESYEFDEELLELTLS